MGLFFVMVVVCLSVFSEGERGANKLVPGTWERGRKRDRKRKDRLYHIPQPRLRDHAD